MRKNALFFSTNIDKTKFKIYNLINLISQGCFRAEIIPFYSFGNANAEDTKAVVCASEYICIQGLSLTYRVIFSEVLL